MPIQFPDFQRISFNEANPSLVGAERGQKLMQNFMQFPQDLRAKILANQIAQVQAKYAEPMAQGNLTKLNLENEWAPKLNQATIGLQGAQSGLAGAQTKNVNAEAEMNNLKLHYLQQMLGGGSASQTPTAGGGSGNSGQSQEFGAVNQASPGMVEDIANNGNSAYRNGSQPAPQQQAPAPQSNAVYGIDTPMPSKNDITNKMLLGMDTFTPKMENAKAQQQEQYKSYQATVASSIQEASTAQKMNQIMAMFNNAMDKARYKGPTFGNAPSSGWATAFMPGDLSAEQIADTQVANLMPGAITDLKDAMGTGKFSNLDMMAASKMKLGRTMSDETRQNQTAWLNGVNERMKERAKFYSTLNSDPRNAPQKATADMAWQEYQNNFPLVGDDGQTFNGSNLGNWPLYTTPKAIASIQTTGSYTPSKAEKSTFMMRIPDGRGGFVIAPVKKGKVESAFRKGARPV